MIPERSCSHGFCCCLADSRRHIYVPEGGTIRGFTIQCSMKQPTDQEERNEDRKKPEKENPSHGIDPESKEPEMEVNQDPGEQRKENQSQKTDDPLAA